MLKKLLIIHTLCLCMFIVLMVSVIDQQQKYRNYCGDLGKISYNLDTDGSREGNMKAIWSYFKTLGFTDEATAGIMGNVWTESGNTFDPKILQGGVSEDQFVMGHTGLGIVQWTDMGRQQRLFDYAKAQGKDKYDLSLQLDFLYNEEMMRWNWGTWFNSLDDLKHSNNLVNVTKAFMLTFEAPACQDDSCIATRVSNAETVLKELKQVQFKPVTITREMNDGRIIWVGDSRFVGMKGAKSTSKDVYIAEVGKGYDWFVDTAIPEVAKNLQDKDTIVIGLGINDLNNVDKYIEKINDLKKNDWKKYSVMFLSVNPVNDERSQNVKNEQIEEFNNKVMDNLIGSIAFIDSYSQLKGNIESNDGVHYDSSTYATIYDIVRSRESSRSHKRVACANYVTGGDGSLKGKPKFDPKIWFTTENPYNGLPGQCTWFVWGRLKEVYGWAPTWTANGREWVEKITTLNKDRYQKSNKPVPGAIFSGTVPDPYGHVGIVIDIEDDLLVIQEGNVDGVTNSLTDHEFVIRECTNGKTGSEANGDWWTRKLTLSQLKEYYGDVTFANPVKRK